MYVGEVSRRWVSWGHHVTLVTAAVEGRPGKDRVDGVHIIRGGSALGVYRHARRWYAGVGRGSADLVIDEINTRPFLCPRWVHDAPVVALAHQVCREVWAAETPLPIALIGRHVLEPWWLRGYARTPVLTVSASSRDSLREYGLQDVRVVGIGRTERRRPDVVRASAPTVVYLGRLSPNKRPDHALAAFAHLRAAVPDAVLHIVGDGPMRGQLERAAPAGVHFHGRVSETTRDALLASSHALIVTSVREGWGMVVDEAAAMGIPSIGYDVPGLRDAIRAAGGIVTAPTPAALGRALVQQLPAWVAHPAASGWHGGAGTWDAVAEGILRQAETAVGANRPVPTTHRGVRL